MTFPFKSIAMLISLIPFSGCINKDPTLGKHDFRPGVFFEDSDVVQLTRAAQTGNLAEIDRLVDQGVNVNAIGKRGATPLMLTFFARNKSGFKRLLERGADSAIQEEQGRSMTHFAALEPHESYWLTECLAHEADPNQVNVENPDAPTPLFCAIISNNIVNMELLIQHGVDLDMPNLHGEKPLVHAAMYHSWEIALFMLENGADPNKLLPNNHGTISLYIRSMPRAIVKRHREEIPWYDRVLQWLDEHDAMDNKQPELESD